MNRPRQKMPLLLILLALAGPACSTEQAVPLVVEGTTTGAGMEIELTIERPPASGDNAFEVAVRKDGAPLDDATITAVFMMPAMPSMNMPEMRSEAAIEPAGAGRYRGTANLSMAGTWNIRVTVARDGQELGTKTLSVVAR